MKLRNKNTGDPVKFVSIESIYKDKLKLTYILSSGLINERYYTSIEKFNDDWEDYKPAEPLIKAEKVRKAVRAWYDALPLDDLAYKRILFNNGHFCVGIYCIDCGDYVAVKDIKERFYAIEELCGEGK